jgi:hypothetical protein
MALYGGLRPPNEVFYSSLRPPTCVVLFVLRALSSFSSVCARRTSRFGKYHQSVSNIKKLKGISETYEQKEVPATVVACAAVVTVGGPGFCFLTMGVQSWGYKSRCAAQQRNHTNNAPCNHSCISIIIHLIICLVIDLVVGRFSGGRGGHARWKRTSDDDVRNRQHQSCLSPPPGTYFCTLLSGRRRRP